MTRQIRRSSRPDDVTKLSLLLKRALEKEPRNDENIVLKKAQLKRALETKTRIEQNIAQVRKVLYEAGYHRGHKACASYDSEIEYYIGPGSSVALEIYDLRGALLEGFQLWVSITQENITDTLEALRKATTRAY